MLISDALGMSKASANKALVALRQKWFSQPSKSEFATLAGILNASEIREKVPV